MKTTPLIFLFVMTSMVTLAQSNSFQTLKDKFANTKGVNCFSTNGFFVRVVLGLAGEHDFNKAIKEINTIKIIIIPTDALDANNGSVKGFRKILQQDSFEELVNVRDHGDDVTVYLQSTKSINHRYIVLVEEQDEVVVMELKGYIDPNLLLQKEPLAFNKL